MEECCSATATTCQPLSTDAASENFRPASVSLLPKAHFCHSKFIQRLSETNLIQNCWARGIRQAASQPVLPSLWPVLTLVEAKDSGARD